MDQRPFDEGTMSEELSLPIEVSAIYKAWKEVVSKPKEWLTDVDGQLVFVAGGGLPLTFGSVDSKIWQALEAAAAEKSGMVTIAGIDFSIKELALMGEFYRSMRGNGYALHCIDERLEDDLGTTDRQVHEHCGACAAAHAVIGDQLAGKHVEDLLLTELGEEIVGKQAIYSSMPHHDSLSVFIDFHGDEAITYEARRTQLREHNALAFQVSLPVNAIKEFLANRTSDQAMLIETLVKWNVQIARNIIGGDHNKLQKHSDKTLFIFDERDVANHELIEQLKQQISNVDHAKELVIS